MFKKILFSIFIFFSLIPILIVISNYWVVSSLNLYVSSIIAYLGIALLFWQIILGNRIFIKHFTSDILRVNKFHQLLGKIGGSLILIHPLLIINYFKYDYSWIFSFSTLSTWESHITLGRIGLTLLLIIIISTVFLKKYLSFNVWKKIHYLSYLLLVLALLHPRDIGFYHGKYFENYWLILMIFTGIIITYRFLSGMGFLSNKGEVIKITQIEGVTNFILKLDKNLNPLPKYGQFVYLSFGRLQESHPFSIVNYDPKLMEIEFAVKKIGDFTNKISKMNEGCELFLDGPYGSLFEGEKIDAPQVYIAGGIGITPFINKIVNSKRISKPYLFYCNSELKDVFMRERFKSISNVNYYDFLSNEKNVSDPSIFSKRISKELINKILSDKLSIAQFYICGSKGFNRGVVKYLKELNVNSENIYLENFV